MTDLMPERTGGDTPIRCDSLVAPADAIPQDQLAEWMFFTEKCMEPAEAIVEFQCENGHTARNAKCETHNNKDEDTRFCGLCASTGVHVPVKVWVVRRL